jgi:hypothetical protein
MPEGLALGSFVSFTVAQESAPKFSVGLNFRLKFAGPLGHEGTLFTAASTCFSCRRLRRFSQVDGARVSVTLLLASRHALRCEWERKRAGETYEEACVH